MQLSLDSAILEHLLERAATASRLVGNIDEDERVGVTLVRSLGDSVDEIVHILSELLGNPDVVIVPVSSTCSPLAADVVAHDDVGTQVVGAEVVMSTRGGRMWRLLPALGCARRKGYPRALLRRGGVR